MVGRRGLFDITCATRIADGPWVDCSRAIPACHASGCRGSHCLGKYSAGDGRAAASGVAELCAGDGISKASLDRRPDGWSVGTAWSGGRSGDRCDGRCSRGARAC